MTLTSSEQKNTPPSSPHLANRRVTGIRQTVRLSALFITTFFAMFTDKYPDMTDG